MGKGNNFWLDDPEWEMLRRKAQNLPISKRLKQQARPAPGQRVAREVPRAQAGRESSEKEVTVNLKLTIPKIKLPNFRRLFRRYRKVLVITGSVAVVAVVGLGGLKLINRDGQAPGTTGEVQGTATEQAKAEFNPLVPLDTASAEPNFKYDAKKKVLGYMADYEGAQMTVSQQKLPDQIKEGKTDLAAIAQSFKAEKTLQTQNGTAYFATDEKSRAQTVVFGTDEVLVFIKSSKSLGDEEWKRYINQLNPSE